MTITPEDLQALIRDYSIEITPKAAQKIGDFRPWLTEGTQVYVPNLRGTKISDCIDTCELLQNQHMCAVPHIVLRNYRSEDELRQTLDRVQALGIDRILLLAGSKPDCYNTTASPTSALPATPKARRTSPAPTRKRQKHKNKATRSPTPATTPSSPNSASKCRR